MKLPTTRKKGKRKSSPTKPKYHFLKFVRKNWKSFGFVIGVVLSGFSWYLIDCLSERRAAHNEYRQAVLSDRTADERYFQDVETLHHRWGSFIAYLAQSSLTLSEVQERENQITSLAQVANDNCNKTKETSYKYFASVEKLSRYFLLPEQPRDLRSRISENLGAKCGGLSALAGKVHLPDAKRLLDDRNYRADYINRELAQLAQNEGLLRQDKNNLDQGKRLDDQVAAVLEKSDANIAKSIWDCLRLPFGFKQPLKP